MDLLLDKEKHDLVFVNRSCPVTRTNEEVVGQRLKIRLLTFRNEYDLNTELGVPWFQTILTKGVSKKQIDSILQEQIMLDEGVVEITSFESTLSVREGIYKLNFRVKTRKGNYVNVDNLNITV